MRLLQWSLVSLIVLLPIANNLDANTVYKGRSYPNFNKPYAPTLTPKQRANVNRAMYNKGWNAGYNAGIYNNYPYGGGGYINTYPAGSYYNIYPTYTYPNYAYPNVYYNTYPQGSTVTPSSSGSSIIYYQNY
jgi:hypothetical protein